MCVRAREVAYDVRQIFAIPAAFLAILNKFA
jgi:hypothetical protein